MSHSLTHPKYRADIDGLRAIAVLGVVGYHAFPDWLRGGFVGVDIFFVISGYLISGIIFSNLESDSFSFVEFYRRRIRRIFPALILVMLAMLIWGWSALIPDAYKQLGELTFASAAFFSNFVLWHQVGYFDGAAMSKPLRHLWSLAIEEQFYIVWPLLVWLVWKKYWGRLPLCLVVMVLSFGINIRLIQHDQTADFYSPLSRFWELTLGSLLAYLTLHPPMMYQRFDACYPNIKAAAGLLLILSALIYAIPQQQFPGWWALAPAVGSFLLISVGPRAWINRALLSNRLLVTIGLISYPLYLWHWPLLSFVYIEGSRLPLIRPAMVAVSVLLAILTYWLVEKPLRFGAHGKEKTALLVVLMVAVGATGYYVKKHDGMGDRFPPLLQDILRFQYGPSEAWRAGTCFLELDTPKRSFKDCTSHPPGVPRQTVVLWGDSMAASLYRGLQKTLGSVDQLTQLTIKGCPPILNYRHPNVDISPYCPAANDEVFNYIKTNKPDRVIMVGLWDNYDWSQIDDTIKSMKRIGIKQIDIIGEFPDWYGSLQQVIFNSYREDPQHRLPERLGAPFVWMHQEAEEGLKARAAKTGVHYISATAILCNEEGCLTRVGDEGDAITSFDNHHLTTKGSEYLAEHLPK